MRVSCCVSVLAPALRRSMTSFISATTMCGMLRPKCWSKLVVLGREDGLFERRRDVVVADDLAALDRELADDSPPRAVDARNRARRVVVERGDRGQVAREGKDDPARDSRSGRQKEERDNPQPTSEAQCDDLSSPASRYCVSRRLSAPPPREARIPRHQIETPRPRTNPTADPTDGKSGRRRRWSVRCGALRSGPGLDR